MDKKRIHEMLECMSKWCLSELDKGKEQIDTEEMGKAIDMVKDLAEAEKCVWEKCYFEKIVEAMEEEKKEMEKLPPEMRFGYDRWRTSTGRFAPKGTGHETSMATATGRAGFMPLDPDQTPYDWPYYDQIGGPRIYAMGYAGQGGNSGGSGNNGSGGSSGQSGSRGGGSNMSGSSGRMGYDGQQGRNSGTPRDGRQSYDDARRYFHESGTHESKQMMDEKATEYVGEAMSTMKDIFAEADPQMQQKMKEDLFRLCREFGITKM